MTKATIPRIDPPEHAEDRFLLRDGAIPVWGIDSNSLVRPDDKGTIVVTGSHGAILGGKPETAIRVDALAAVYHDAGIGKEQGGHLAPPGARSARHRRRDRRRQHGADRRCALDLGDRHHLACQRQWRRAGAPGRA